MNPQDHRRSVQDAQNESDLNPAECFKVFAMNAGYYGNREKLLARLKADVQAAIAVELATIPIYLYS
jgi:hypothetical protein